MFFLIFIILQLVYTKELSALLETVKNNDFSLNLMKDMKKLMNEKKSAYEILYFINEEENKLVSEIIEDMNSYQQEQIQSSQKKQELKYQMMLTKFTSSLQGDELLLLSNEAKLSEDIRMQRVDLLLELGQVIPLLDSLHQEELAGYDYENSQLSILLNNLVNDTPQVQQQKLNGQKQHHKDNPEAILKEFITTNSDQSNFNQLINLLSINPGQTGLKEAKQQMREFIIDQQKQLQNNIKNKTSIYENISQGLSQDNEQWKMDMASIEPIAKITKEKLAQLQKQKDDLQVTLKQQQNQFNELQESIDNCYTTYSSKRLQDMNNLNVIRMIKQFYSDHLDVLEEFVKNKIQ